MAKKYYTTAEAAEILGVKTGTMPVWRSQGRGPKFVKIGGKVRYTDEHIDEYVENNTFTSTTEYEAGI